MRFVTKRATNQTIAGVGKLRRHLHADRVHQPERPGSPWSIS